MFGVAGHFVAPVPGCHCGGGVGHMWAWPNVCALRAAVVAISGCVVR